ncbi:hypothetical protein SAMN05880556_10280 [Azospirillum sp. RU38E]|nr:hypothetical protein SAMN05880556_10280 [Azospirillum sp. RU38E]SNS29327.1 hypothetical protein SAMN05880591_10280 [Azospirillum sp. RU37A]
MRLSVCPENSFEFNFTVTPAKAEATLNALKNWEKYHNAP